MTTNKTIDGVPRELMRWLDDYLNDGLALSAEEESVSAQLRALLDAPAVESELARMTRRCQNAELALKVQTENYEALKAPQPQGEPVAIVVEEIHNYGDFLVFGSTIPGVQRPKPVVELKAHLLDRTLPNGTKLYAEQPAPVAVVMPERSNAVVSANASARQAYSLGWNACLGEVARLNTARPAHANPPPGTEPCGTHPDNDGLDEWRKP